MVQAAAGAMTGLLATASEHVSSSTTLGIVIFAVGIFVGLVSGLTADVVTRRRMARDYNSWVAQGKPERRIGERRGIGARRGRR
jgi:hypothetical protein